MGFPTRLFILGGIQQLRGQTFAIFLPPPTLRGQFLYPERGRKQKFFDPSPHLVHVVIEWPLMKRNRASKLFEFHVVTYLSTYLLVTKRHA